MTVTTNEVRVLPFPTTPQQPDEPPEPGVYRDMSAADYFKVAACSQSFLKRVQPWAGCDRRTPRTPGHAFAHLMVPQDDDTDALLFGRAYHTLLFEPDEFDGRYHITPKITRRGGAWKAVLAAAEHRDVVWTEDHERMLCMRSVLRRNKRVRRVMEARGETEAAAFWNQPIALADGTTVLLPCKMRLDHFALETTVDIKSCLIASQSEFGRDAAKFGYHIQVWKYRLGLKALRDVDARWLFVAQEKSPPYAAACYTPSAQDIEAGGVAGMAAMRTVARCIIDNEWPCYDDKIAALQLPPYAFPEGDL